MKAILVGAKTWAWDNGENMPSIFIPLSNECQVTKVLICGADPVRTPPAKWELITPENISYEIVNLNLKVGDTSNVFLRCKIHGFVGYSDVALIDGKKELHK